MKFSLTQYFLLIAILTLFLQCNNDLEEEKMIAEDKQIEVFLTSYGFTKENGVYHAIVSPSYGYRVANGDSIAFWYKGYTLDKKVFETNILVEAILAKLDTATRSFDSIFIIAGSGDLVEGLNLGMLQCRGGQKSIVAFSSSFGFGNQNIGPIPAWSPLAYDISIIYVYNSSIRKEQQTIIQLLGSSENHYLQHSMGFWYNIDSIATEDINPALGDTIYGWYNAITPTGQIFKHTLGKNDEYIIGEESITVGLSAGFSLLRPGDKASLIVPSPIAYGNEGEGIIEPYSPVVYQIRLDSIK